jgi:YbgC/YbaW family acyl-CoA thioester hydrolase
MISSDSPLPYRRAGGTKLAVDISFQPEGEALRAAKLEDLSEAGACISAVEPGAEGEVVTVHLPWPSRETPTRVRAIVRWVDGSQMGVQFSSSSADESGEFTKNPFAREALLTAEPVLHQMSRRVAFQEVDAAGTIYYARVYEYFGDAYIDLLEKGGVSLAAAMQSKVWFAPLVHSEADYLSPMRFGDSVTVHVVKVDCRASAATVGYRIVSPEGLPLAVGCTVHVFVDSSFRRCPVPPDVRRALTVAASEPTDRQ